MKKQNNFFFLCINLISFARNVITRENVSSCSEKVAFEITSRMLINGNKKEVFSFVVFVISYVIVPSFCSNGLQLFLFWSIYWSNNIGGKHVCLNYRKCGTCNGCCETDWIWFLITDESSAVIYDSWRAQASGCVGLRNTCGKWTCLNGEVPKLEMNWFVFLGPQKRCQFFSQLLLSD